MLAFNWGIFWAILAALALRGTLKVLISFWDIGIESTIHHISENLWDVRESVNRISAQMESK